MARKRNKNWDQDVYDKYHKMACKIASQYAKKYRRPYEEFKAEAEFELATTILTGKWKTIYNPKKGAGSSWMYRRVYWKLKDLVIADAKEQAINFTGVNENGMEIEDKKRDHSWVEKIMMEVSEEAAFVIKAIMYAPSDMIEDERKAKQWIKGVRDTDAKTAKEMVKDYMVNELDWSIFKFNQVIEEVRACL